MRATTISLLSVAVLLTWLGGIKTSPLHADTVFLKNGSAIDGIMVGRKEGVVLLQIGNLGRMEIPEKEIKHIEKNTRTGYVDPDRGSSKRKVLTEKKGPGSEADPGEDGEEGDGSEEEGEKPLTAEQEKKVKQWVYDLTRQRTAYRVRAERRLTDVGANVIPHVLPLTKHPAELTRIAALRIFKNVVKDADEDVILACLDALNDEKRFVRKMAWECLRKATGKRYRYAWDDDDTEKSRERDRSRWQKWWTQEKKRREEAHEAEEEVKRGAGQR